VSTQKSNTCEEHLGSGSAPARLQRRRALGDDHPDMLSSIHNTGALLRDLRQRQETEELGAEAVRRARTVLPAGRWQTAVYVSGHARTLAALERFAEAEMLEAHETLVACFGPAHKRTVGVIESLIELYAAWRAAEPDKGYDAKADKWRAKMEKRPGSTQLATASQRSTPGDWPAEDP